MHADVNDGGLPVSVALTAASVHDSQVAIPLMKMSSSKVDYLYDVMDAAYDAGPIYEVSRSLGHVPLIDKNPRGKEVVPMAPHEATRYNERTAVERFNGFCARCGTQISFAADYIPGLIDITIGSLDQPESMAPSFHYWDSKRLPWIHLADGLPRHQEFPPME